MSGRRDLVFVACLAAAAAGTVVALRGCDAAKSPEPAPRAPEPPRPRKPRRGAPAEPARDAPAGAPAEGPLHVEGWPAAEVIVLHPEGMGAAGAIVYVHPAGADSPASLDRIPRWTADAEGRTRVVAPAPGRYDVGAFLGPGFAVLATDVELPAVKPLELRLPRLTELTVAYGPDTPRGAVYVRPAAAERAAAFPGRREARSATYGLSPPLPTSLLVPADVALRVTSDPGLVAEPSEVTAPGSLAVRADPARTFELEFALHGPAPSADATVECELRVAVVGPDAPPPARLVSRGEAGAAPPSPRLVMRCPREEFDVSWALTGGDEGTARVDTRTAGADGRIAVAIPVRSWTPFTLGLEVRVHGAVPRRATVLTEQSSAQTAADGAVRLAGRGARRVTAFVREPKAPVLVAEAQPAPERGTVDLTLVPGGSVRFRAVRPGALGQSWPLTVERADGEPLIARSYGRIGAMLAREIPFDGGLADLGPFVAGDVDFVFRLAGREVHRERVTIAPDAALELTLPEILPPRPR